MATSSEQERALETELELQLQDQRDSLAALNEALSSDPSNSELISVSEELVLAIKVAEEGLFHLKRARLLREIDSELVGLRHGIEKDAKAGEPLEPKPLENLGYRVGSKCRFRYSDGRWYNGQIIALDGSNSAKISFLTPTSENMLMCKFFRQQRCRFGTNCRLSHGIDVPLSALKKYTPTVWEKSLVGSSVLATTTDGNGSLWREAELESWDDELGVAKVVFGDDRSSANLGNEAITLSEYADMSDEEESGSSADGSRYGDEDDDDDESLEGLGFLDSSDLKRGIQKQTTMFAEWENHTRGIASKMMANMGYREGMGLGASGQGMVDPISVRVLPAKQSLDLAFESREGKKLKEDRGSGKKRSRGGKRKRDKKFAALARAAKAEEEMAPDVFTIINTQLANGSSARKPRLDRDSGDGKKVDRRSLVAFNHEVKDLRVKVERLEEMVNRNRREKAVYEAAMRKLTETREALADAEAAHASASNEVFNREKEKRWLKF